MMPSQGLGMRLRPMTVGDIIDETIKLYRRHFLAFVTATGVFAVAGAVYSISIQALTAQFRSGQMPSLSQMTTLLGIAVPGGILLAGGSLWSYAAAVRVASDAILGRTPDVGAAFRAAIARTFSFIWVWILIMFPILGLFTAAGVVPLIMYLGGLSPLAWVPVLIVLAVAVCAFVTYLGLGWSLTWQVIMVEDIRGRGAMRRSSFLVSGYRWRILGISLLMSILVSILASVPTAIIGGSAAALSFSRNPAGGDMTFQVINAVLSAVAQALFGSLSWIAVTILYYELRVRKEAFDLEQRVFEGDPLASLPSA